MSDVYVFSVLCIRLLRLYGYIKYVFRPRTFELIAGRLSYANFKHSKYSDVSERVSCPNEADPRCAQCELITYRLNIRVHLDIQRLLLWLFDWHRYRFWAIGYMLTYYALWRLNVNDT